MNVLKFNKKTNLVFCFYIKDKSDLIYKTNRWLDAILSNIYSWEKLIFTFRCERDDNTCVFFSSLVIKNRTNSFKYWFSVINIIK